MKSIVLGFFLVFLLLTPLTWADTAITETQSLTTNLKMGHTNDIIPPVIWNPTPSQGGVVINAQPTISVNIVDNPDGSGIDTRSIVIGIKDTEGSFPALRLLHQGVRFDNGLLTVDLNEAGVSLHEGEVRVTVDAKDKARNVAQSFDFSFTVQFVRLGDVNKDGKLNGSDVQLLRFFLFGFSSLTADQRAAADVAWPCSGGMALNFTDLNWLQRAVHEGSDEFECAFEVPIQPADLVEDITPPIIWGPSPKPDSLIGNNQPIISVNLVDDSKGTGIDLFSLSIQLRGEGLRRTFRLRDAGVDFDDGLLIVDLAEADVVLSQGRIEVTIQVRDNAGNEALALEFDFTLRIAVPGDIDGDGRLTASDVNMLRFFLFGLTDLRADQRAAADVAFPCTQGESLTFADLAELQRVVKGNLTAFSCFADVKAFTLLNHSAPQLDAQLRLETVSLSRSGGTIQFLAEGVGVGLIDVRVFGLDGNLIFDSGFQPGNALGWNLLNDESQLVANGVYLYVVTVKGPDGTAISNRVGKLAILR